jgi:hypothetical protein
LHDLLLNTYHLNFTPLFHQVIALAAVSHISFVRGGHDSPHEGRVFPDFCSRTRSSGFTNGALAPYDRDSQRSIVSFTRRKTATGLGRQAGTRDRGETSIHEKVIHRGVQRK